MVGSMAKKACPRCVAHKANREQCKIKTCKYHPKCYVHTVHQDKLLISKSTIPRAGNGLFTLKDRDKGETITQYRGKVLTENQMNEKYPGDTRAPYAIKVNKNKYIDAAKTPSGMARYANHGNVNKQNAKMARTRGQKVVLKATKNIPVPAGGKKEILVDYGKGYWKRNPTRQSNKGKQTHNAHR